jgi:hypothetical protein
MSVDISHLPSPEEIEKTTEPAAEASPIDISHLPIPDKNVDEPFDIVKNIATYPDKLANAYGQAASHIPLIGNLVKGSIDSAHDAAIASGKGATFGFRNKLLGGVEGAARTGLDVLENPGSITEPSEIYKNLINNYHKYKDMEENREKDASNRSPMASIAGSLAGGFTTGAPIVKGAQALGLTGEGLLFANNAKRAEQGLSEITPAMRALDTLKSVPAGAGMGALSAAGNDEDIGQGALIGGIAGPVSEQMIGPGIAKTVNKIGSVLEESPFAKRLAATIKNASEGGSLFGKSNDTKTVSNIDSGLNEITDKLVKPIEDVNNKYSEIYGKASQEGRLVNPKSPPTSDPMTAFQNTANNMQTNDVELAAAPLIQNKKLDKKSLQLVNKVIDGTALPNDANEALKAIKLAAFEDPASSGQYKDLYSVIEQKLNQAVPEINNSNLREQGHIARGIVDPFVSEANELQFNPDSAKRMFSDLPDSSTARANIKNQLQRLVKNAGESKMQGADATSELQQLQDYLKTLSKVSDQRNLNLNIDPNIPEQLQKLSYLRGAQRGVLGSTSSGTEGSSLPTTLEKAFNGITNVPYRAAELLGKNTKIGPDIATKLLGNNPLNIQKNIEILSRNPKTANLAQQLINAKDINNSAKITNTAYQILQNPEAKKTLGITNGIQPNIPGVVTKNGEGNQ